jgi:hypothetical protein
MNSLCKTFYNSVKFVQLLVKHTNRNIRILIMYCSYEMHVLYQVSVRKILYVFYTRTLHGELYSKNRFCYVAFNSHMFNATEVQL